MKIKLLVELDISDGILVELQRLKYSSDDIVSWYLEIIRKNVAKERKSMLDYARKEGYQVYPDDIKYSVWRDKNE